MCCQCCDRACDETGLCEQHKAELAAALVEQYREYAQSAEERDVLG